MIVNNKVDTEVNRKEKLSNVKNYIIMTFEQNSNIDSNIIRT